MKTLLMALLAGAAFAQGSPNGAERLNRLPDTIGGFTAQGRAIPAPSGLPIPGRPIITGGADLANRFYDSPQGAQAEVVWQYFIGAMPVPEGADNDTVRMVLEGQARDALGETNAGWQRQPGLVPVGTDADTGLLCVRLTRPGGTQHRCATGIKGASLIIRLTQAAGLATPGPAPAAFMLPVVAALRGQP